MATKKESAPDSDVMKDFADQWKVKFDDEPPPKLTCFDNVESDATTKRKAVQDLLDDHNVRVTDLQKKLQREQFIMEFLAQELEKMPVPRQSSATPPAADRPVPSPRGRRPPPPTAKKPSVKSSTDSVGGVLRRNKSTPSPRHSGGADKQHQFRSVMIPSTGSLDEASPTEEHEHIKIKTPVITPSNSVIEDDTEVTKDRFKSFQGSTFGGRSPQLVSQISQRDSVNSQSSSPVTVNDTSAAEGDTPAETPESTLHCSPSVIIEKRADSLDDDIIAAPTPSRVARNSMKNMDRISIRDPQSTSEESSPDSSADYMHLWDINKPPGDVQRSSSTVSNDVSIFLVSNRVGNMKPTLVEQA